MRKINLGQIIKDYDLSVNEISKQLFPTNKHPRLALSRVLSGEAVLDANQISKLAMIIDRPISELFTGGKWKVKSSKGTHIFFTGDYRAELNKKTNFTRIFHKDSLAHSCLITPIFISLSDYLEKLDLEILKFKK